MFGIALQNVLLTLAYILPGFGLAKWKKASADHLPTLSTILVYICGPCMIINSYLRIGDFSWTELAKMGEFFAVTLILQAAFMLILFGLFKKKYDDAKYRILTIGSTMGNVGYFGLPVVKAMIPDAPEVMCYSAVYVISMNILIFTVGVFCLTKDKKYMSIKSGVCNPTMVGFIIALVCYAAGVGKVLPPIVGNAVKLVGDMTTPLCMFILGIRLSTVSMKKLFTRPMIYATCACKLILFPLFCYAIVVFLPFFDYAFKASILILSSVPCASVILNMAEIHHSETELSANCVLVSTLLCFITIPLLVLIL